MSRPRMISFRAFRARSPACKSVSSLKDSIKSGIAAKITATFSYFSEKSSPVSLWVDK